MESEYRKGYVYIQNRFAGIIAETEEGYVFTYDREYLKSENAVAVSLTLPLREEPYETTILFPFFDGLIRIKKFFHTEERPVLDITKDQLEVLASQTVNEGLTVPGLRQEPRIFLLIYPEKHHPG